MKRIKTIIPILLLFLCTEIGAKEFKPSFFVFEDGLWNAESNSTDYWAALVKNSGFDGMELIGLDRIDSMLPELKKYNLRLFTLYIQIDLEKEQPYDSRLKEYIRKMKDTGLHLWVHVHSENIEPSDTKGDERCVAIISELAGYAEKYNVRIAFYPHSNFWVEKVGDGVRLAKKINRKNVGTVFNLCHFLKGDETDNLEAQLKNAMPYLFLVSINGADDGDTHQMGWDSLIQPLGRGNYDVYHVLELLKEFGYNNPVGLQCYNIEGKPEAFLKESVNTWRKYINQLNR
jgi:sugar phosphate isomerase/epimerase